MPKHLQIHVKFTDGSSYDEKYAIEVVDIQMKTFTLCELKFPWKMIKEVIIKPID